MASDESVKLLREIRDLQAAQLELIAEIKEMNAESAAKSEQSLARSEDSLRSALAAQAETGRFTRFWDVGFVVILAVMLAGVAYAWFSR